MFPLFFSRLFNLLVDFSIKFCSFSRILLLLQFPPFVTQLCYIICDPGLLCWSVFSKDVVGCFCHSSVKAVDQSVYRCSTNFCDAGFVWTRCVHHLQVDVTDDFSEPRTSVVGLSFAVLVACPPPRFSLHPSHPALQGCLSLMLVYDFLHLIIEVFNVNIIVSWWGIRLDDGDVKG